MAVISLPLAEVRGILRLITLRLSVGQCTLIMINICILQLILNIVLLQNGSKLRFNIRDFGEVTVLVRTSE
jgi:hypothetical protein